LLDIKPSHGGHAVRHTAIQTMIGRTLALYSTDMEADTFSYKNVGHVYDLNHYISPFHGEPESYCNMSLSSTIPPLQLHPLTALRTVGLFFALVIPPLPKTVAICHDVALLTRPRLLLIVFADLYTTSSSIRSEISRVRFWLVGPVSLLYIMFVMVTLQTGSTRYITGMENVSGYLLTKSPLYLGKLHGQTFMVIA
jgi:hypothetical protein